MPIVQHILKNGNTDDTRLYGLILTPTRELAMQVKDHIVNIAKFSKIKVKFLLLTHLDIYLRADVWIKFLGRCYCWWYVGGQATTSIEESAKYHCCNTWSFMGNLLWSKCVSLLRQATSDMRVL